MTMHARYQTATGRLLHWSPAPFTAAPGAGEADAELPDGTTLPAPAAFVRVADGALATDGAAWAAAQWAKVRAARDARLAACDWTQSVDVPWTVNRAAWAAYRQALRDLPQTTADPDAVVWPVAPS